MRLFVYHQWTISCNERLIGTTTATDDIYQTLIHELTHLGRHRLSRLVIEAHRVGQSCIGIGTNIIRCTLGEFTQERFHLRGTKRTVQSYRKNVVGADAGKESVERLSTQRTTSQITHRHRQHDR